MSSNSSDTATAVPDIDPERIIHVDHDNVALSDIAIGVIIGRTSEYFNFFVFGIAAALVFPSVFFPYVSLATGTMYSFVIFSFAFIARPFGSQLFSILHTRYGRGTKLTIALFALGTTTACIAFLPGYKSIGFSAVIVLALLRIAQGLSVGGSWDGLPSLLQLKAPREHRGWFAMIPQLSAPIGFIIAAALFAYLTASLSHDDFIAWGWRYPFFVAFALNVVALFARMRLVVAPQFNRELQAEELNPVPLGDLMRKHGLTVFLGALAPLASYALFHMVTIFALAWASLFTLQSISQFLVVQAIGAAIAIVCMALSGTVANYFGRRRTLGILAGLIAVYSGWTAALLAGSTVGGYLFILIGFALLGFSHALSAGSLTSGLGKAYRYSGALFTSDLGWFFGAAFAPLVSLALALYLGVSYTGLYLLSGAVVTLAVLRFNYLFEAD